VVDAFAVQPGQLLGELRQGHAEVGTHPDGRGCDVQGAHDVVDSAGVDVERVPAGVDGQALLPDPTPAGSGARSDAPGGPTHPDSVPESLLAREFRWEQAFPCGG
jgi:hypothetical protein